VGVVSGGAAAHDGLPDEEDEVIGGCVDPSRRGGVLDICIGTGHGGLTTRMRNIGGP